MDLIFSQACSAALLAPEGKSPQTATATSGGSNSIRSGIRWLELNSSINASASSLLPDVIALSKPSISDICARGLLTPAMNARMPALSGTTIRSTPVLLL
jgi:hypothetical protein